MSGDRISGTIEYYRGVEQLVARRAHNPKVVGSNPSPATSAQIAQLVEQRTENPRVTGSIPVLGILFSRMSARLTNYSPKKII